MILVGAKTQDEGLMNKGKTVRRRCLNATTQKETNDFFAVFLIVEI
jgi:hypothetical protein